MKAKGPEWGQQGKASGMRWSLLIYLLRYHHSLPAGHVLLHNLTLDQQGTPGQAPPSLLITLPWALSKRAATRRQAGARAQGAISTAVCLVLHEAAKHGGEWGPPGPTGAILSHQIVPGKEQLLGANKRGTGPAPAGV